MKQLIFISLACTAIHLSGPAQNPMVGITAGAAFSNYSVKFEDVTIKGKSRTGITGGILVDIPLNKTISLQPAANFVQYGSSFEETSGSYTEKDEIKVNALEVPVNIIYNAPAGKGRFFIGAGPAFGFHLSGKRKSWNSYNDEEEVVTLKFGSSADADMRAINISANVTTGYALANGLFFSACYNQGFYNLEPGDSDGSTKSHYFGIKIGYFFKKI